MYERYEISNPLNNTTMKRFTQIMALGLAALVRVPAAAQAQKKNKEKVGSVAHRGFWNCDEAGYAKNSIAALRCAQEAGCWGSEFDVNMTSDGVLLVYHDGNVEGKSIEKNPHSAFKYYRLKNGEPIPTIDEYLTQAKKYPKTVLVYELKPHSCPEVESKFVDLTIQKLREHKLLNPKKVIFISFSYHMCKEVAKKLPNFTVQYLGGNKAPKDVMADGINGIDYHHGSFRKNPSWSNDARALKMSRNVWTVNDKKVMDEMYKMGVDFITTDTPLDARQVLKDKNMKEKRVKGMKPGKK